MCDAPLFLMFSISKSQRESRQVENCLKNIYNIWIRHTANV